MRCYGDAEVGGHFLHGVVGVVGADVLQEGHHDLHVLSVAIINLGTRTTLTQFIQNILPNISMVFVNKSIILFI